PNWALEIDHVASTVYTHSIGQKPSTKKIIHHQIPIEPPPLCNLDLKIEFVIEDDSIPIFNCPIKGNQKTANATAIIHKMAFEEFLDRPFLGLLHGNDFCHAQTHCHFLLFKLLLVDPGFKILNNEEEIYAKIATKF
ncbi:hypothetical protein BpHYR1_020188, partial [Brachionus plicatilis]